MSLTPIYAVLAASAPQSPTQELLDIDGTLFIQLGIFLVVTFALTQLLWKPYLRVKTERIHRVDGYREEARSMDAEAQARLGKIETELTAARRLGSTERARARTEAQADEQKLVAQAQTAAQKALVEARAKIDASLASERANLMARAALLGREAAERVLGRKVA